MKTRLLLFIAFLALLPAQMSFAEQLWVGQTYQCFMEDYADKSLSWVNISWSVDYGLYENYSGNYVRTVSFSEYKSGTYNVTVKWTQTDMSDSFAPFYHKSHTWSFTCRDNPLNMSQTSIELAERDTKQLNCSFTYNNNYTQGISYKSSNPDVATVSSSGLVTAKAAGTATITASSASSRDDVTCTITVTSADVKVTSVSLNKTTMSLQIGEEETLTPTVKPNNATDKSVSWSSSPTGIVTVSNTGLVKAVKEGTTTVTCKANDGSGKQATCAVTVVKPEVVVAEINSTNFPDAAFRNWLLSQSYGADGRLTESEIQNVKEINVSFKEISSIKGVEYFTALTTLNCSSNQLQSLDVSKNTKLTSLKCSNNLLTELDVSFNTSLTYLDCANATINGESSGNLLKKLDVSKNTKLVSLSCYRNALKKLDVSKNTALVELRCQYNELTHIDVSKNLKLKTFAPGDNPIKTLDISNNIELERLACFENLLTNIDISKNTKLTFINCYRNYLNGKTMDEFINGLPQNKTNDEYKLLIHNNDIDNEGNFCTTKQIAVVKAKGWTPYFYNDEGEAVEYEGLNNALVCSNIEGEKAKQVVLPIALFNESSVTGLQLDLYLPEGVTVAKNDKGKMLINTTTRMEGNYTISSNSMEDGKFIRILGYSGDGDAFTGEEGDVLNVTLNISNTMADGIYTVRVKNIVLSDVNNNEYRPTNTAGILTIKNYTIGDVDNSGAVNINDVVCIINFILNRSTGTFVEAAADVDGNGTININDVVTLINKYILNRTNSPTNRSSSRVSVADNNDLHLADICINPGETQEISMLLTNADEVKAVQGNIVLPDGLNFVTKANGRLDVTNNNSRAEDFTLSCAIQEDGSMTFAHYSADGYAYESTSGGIFTFKIKAADNAIPGTYQIKLKDIVLSIDGIGYDLPERLSLLVINGAAPYSDYFTAKTSEGIDMSFKIISAIDKTCQVSIDSQGSTAVSKDITGMVTIPESANGFSVISIGASAFENCSSITSVIIPSTIQSIGEKAFCGCTELTDIYSYIEEPCEITDNTFSDYSSKHLYVPKGKYNVYRNKIGWENFGISIYESCKLDIAINNNVYYSDNPTITIDKGEEIILTPVDIEVIAIPTSAGVKIYYTLDGTTPTETKTLYQEPIVINNTCKLQAISYHHFYETSDVKTVTIEVNSSGINTILTDKSANNNIFNLTGQKLGTPQKGINIIGGKKVVVR